MKYKAVLLASSLVLSAMSNAGTTLSEVDRVLLYDGGKLIYIYPKNGVTNPPSCHNSSDGGDYYSFSSERPMAKEYLSALLAAQARKASVTFWGKGSCVDQGNAETLDYFRIEN